ncbi:maleylpyruvate isomerase N-terminal domain-containing protein [Kineosporia sp. A_224]|uniref:maleylpyruvate isomerase N-terminal domain-containing protein n=1 Tax=Kineosporia sp. A_224 TaxID=1962180 RepID=UPI000B4B2D45|nr:maleylpyruvate isomerase N-terminal domain-containing protein [Kineosporia sp. A_224]
MTTDPTGPGDGSDYVEHVRRESARFLEAVLAADPAATVPTCPDWSADDLLWHLACVQHFWGDLVERAASGPEGYVRPERPTDRAGLAGVCRAAGERLVRVLAAAPPSAPVWTWAADRTVGFVRRRQAQEALVHRLDAELVAGQWSALDPVLAADGVDEVLHVMYGGLPEWGTLTREPEGCTVRLDATDVGRTWLVGLATWSGTDPSDATVYSGAPVLRVVPDGDPAAARPAGALVSGTAADLLCDLWQRPPLGTVVRSGDDAVLAALSENLAAGVQ